MNFHPFQSEPGRRVVIIATGGTIAGQAASATDNLGYTSGQRTAQDLVAAVPALQDASVETEQVANIDSKDMTVALWVTLMDRVKHHLARAEVGGVVITHGTDTLEETAWWLHRTVVAHKPVVLTAAMKPASSLQADGPQNLLDAVRVAALPLARGLMLVMAGQVWEASGVRKVFGQRKDPFANVDQTPLGVLHDEGLRLHGPWPVAEETQWVPVRQALAAWCSDLPADEADWPWVAVITSHGGADARVVQALQAAGVAGLVVAATGHGTVHQRLEAALGVAARQGVRIIRASRCGLARVGGAPVPGTATGADLSPAQARVELLLRLLGCPTAQPL